MLLHQDGNCIRASSLTSCTFVMDYIFMSSGIAQSRWYGWEEVADDDGEDFVESSLTVAFAYNCAGTGTHDYRLVTDSEVEIGSTEYTVDAYDLVTDAECSS